MSVAIETPLSSPPYKISPSDLTYLYKDCRRCFHDKVKLGFKLPRSFSEHFTNADRAMRQAMLVNEIVDIGVEQKFRVIAQGEYIESQPIRFDSHGVSLSFAGKFDAVVRTEDNLAYLVDYKTTTLDDYALRKFHSQLMAYVTAIERPRLQLTLLPRFIDGIALLVFDPRKFAFNARTKNCGLYGPVRWVELARDQQNFDDLMQNVARILADAEPPQPDRNCDICKLRLGATQSSNANPAGILS